MCRLGGGAGGGRVESDDRGVVEADAFAEGCGRGAGGEGGGSKSCEEQS